jgi:ABC-2 type transport system ATP-binding protein
MSEIALRFSGVGKSYGRTPILRDVTFEVTQGEFFGLVGINGAGKTTLLKCLLDFCAADRGTIEIFGTSHSLAMARRRLAFLPERFNPPYYLTGEDFIRYVLDMQAVAYNGADAERMLRALDLDLAALNLPVRAYSKGMTQKLGLAACLLSRKDLYILDEPTSGLDPKARALFKSQLRELKQQARTVFFTSHALADVAEVCDRMAVMHAGTLRFAGTPDALCRQYAGADLEQAFLLCIGAAPQPV